MIQTLREHQFDVTVKFGDDQKQLVRAVTRTSRWAYILVRRDRRLDNFDVMAQHFETHGEATVKSSFTQ